MRKYLMNTEFFFRDSLEQLNQKSVEMKAMIHQFTESAKKIEDKSID